VCIVNVHITENTLVSLSINSQDQQRKKEQQCSTFLNVTKVQYIAAINAGNHQKANSHKINQHLGKESNPKMFLLFKMKVFLSLYFSETSV